METKLKLSSKLVGRDGEIDLLQEVYRSLRDDRRNFDHSLSNSIGGSNSSGFGMTINQKMPKSRSIYVKGLSGTGKSSLVQTALKDFVENDSNFFCQGKFDQNRSHRPFSAIVDALDSLCLGAQVKFDQFQLERIKTDLMDSFGVDGVEAIGKLIPTFLEFMKADMSFPSHFRNTHNAATNQRQQKNEEEDHSASTASSSIAPTFHNKLASRDVFFELTLMLRHLIKTIVVKDVLVLFIDDLQWATLESLELLKDFLTNLRSVKFMFVGGFRSNDATKNHFLTKLLEDHQINNNRPIITVGPLEIHNLAEFIALSINMEPNDVLPLAEFIQERTGGNIFHVKQYLEFLHSNGHLYYSLVKFAWEWEDLSMIQDNNTGSDDIDAFVSKKIMKMPQHAIVALMIASCLGSRFDVDTIQMLVENDWKAFSRVECAEPTENIESILWHAVEENLIEEIASDPFSISEVPQYKFIHDRVQSSSYALIGEAQAEFHSIIGQRLWKYYKSSDKEAWRLIFTADQLCKGKLMLRDQAEKDEVSELIIQAAVELRKAASFDSAAEFCRNAIYLLGHESWERCYKTTLKLYDLAAEMEFCSGSQDKCGERVHQCLERAQCLEDQYNAYWILVENLASKRRFDSAVDAGYSLLKKMKLSRLPTKITTAHMIAESVGVLSLLEKHTVRDLLHKDDTTNKSAAFYIKLLVQISVHSWFSEEPEKVAFFGLRATRMSLKYGYTPATSTGITVCAIVLLLLSNRKFGEARRLGGVAMELRKRWNDPESKIWTEFMDTVFIQWTWDRKLIKMDKTLWKLHNVSVASGNTSVACMTGASAIFHAFFDGSLRLDRLASKAAQSCAEQIAFNKLNFYCSTRIFRQVILNLAGRSKNPLVIEGEEIKNWNEFKKEIVADYAPLRQSVIMPMILCYIFGDIREAKKLADWSLKTWRGDYPSLVSIFVPFFRCLIYARKSEEEISSIPHGKQWSLRRKAKTDFRLIRSWAKGESLIARILATFLEAEWKIVEKCPDSEVQEEFDKAIHALKEFDFGHIAAMASERLGDYFVERKKPELAFSYYTKAVEGFQAWGALAKVRDIVEMEEFGVDFFQDGADTLGYFSSVEDKSESYELTTRRLPQET